MIWLLAIIFLFDSSPSADVEFYICSLQERHRIEVPCPPGLEPPCYGTSVPAPVPCDIWPDINPGRASEFFAETIDVSQNQALMGCVLAVDFYGNQSECVGGGSGASPGTTQ